MVAYELLVCTCVDLWETEGDLNALREAVEVAERSRARNLIDRLHGTDLMPANAPPERVAEFHALRRRLELAQLRLEREEQGFGRDDGSFGGAVRLASSQPISVPETGPYIENALTNDLNKIQAEIEQLECEYNTVLAELRRGDPDYSPEGAASALTFADIQKLVPTDMPTAFVQFTLTQEETIALVITKTEVFPIRLKELTLERSGQLAAAWFSGYYNESYKKEMRSAEHEAKRLRERRFIDWEKELPKVLEQIAALVVRPLAQALAGRGLRRLVISPNRALHIFPLHACQMDGAVTPSEDGASNQSTRYFGDEFEIVYTPSLSILDRCIRRDRHARGDTLVVANPTDDLWFTDPEVAALERRYPEGDALRGREATKKAFLDAAGSSWLLHYCGHTMFNTDDQMASGLILAQQENDQMGDLLTLREIFAGLNLRRNFLTILNGCESGMLRPDLVDEYVTLPSGFLYAGAVCVVSTLWAVHDLSAALLMDRFHAEWQAGKSVAAALREAMRWLREDIRDGLYLMKEVVPAFLESVDAKLRERCQEAAQIHANRYPDTPPFASPVHWAAFIATGLSYTAPNPPHTARNES